MNDLTKLFQFFGSAYKNMLLIAIVGLLLLLLPEHLRKQFYLDDFINTYGIWLGIATILSSAYIVISTIEKTFLHIKNRVYRSEQKQKLLEALINLGFNEKKILLHFLQQNKQMTHFSFFVEAVKPEAIEHLTQMGFLTEVSNRQGTYYYRLQDEVWSISLKNWQKIFYEIEFQPKKLIK